LQRIARRARVCAHLAEDCEDQDLTRRLRLVPADLAPKADEVGPCAHRAGKTPQAVFGNLVNRAPLRPHPNGRHDRQDNRHCKYGQHKKHRHHRQHLASSEAKHQSGCTRFRVAATRWRKNVRCVASLPIAMGHRRRSIVCRSPSRLRSHRRTHEWVNFCRSTAHRICVRKPVGLFRVCVCPLGVLDHEDGQAGAHCGANE
jgi:hypothetical protein